MMVMIVVSVRVIVFQCLMSVIMVGKVQP